MTDQEAEQLYGAVKAYNGPGPRSEILERLRGFLNSILPPGVGIDRNYGHSIGFGDYRIAITPGYQVGSSMPVVLTRGVPLTDRPGAELGSRAEVGDLSPADRAYKEGQGLGFAAALAAPAAAERALIPKVAALESLFYKRIHSLKEMDDVIKAVSTLKRGLSAVRGNALLGAVGQAMAPSSSTPQAPTQEAYQAPQVESAVNVDKPAVKRTYEFQPSDLIVNKLPAQAAMQPTVQSPVEVYQEQPAVQPVRESLPERMNADQLMEELQWRYPRQEIAAYKPSRNIVQRVLGFASDLVNNPLNTDRAKLANERAYYTNELMKRAPYDEEARQFLTALQNDQRYAEQGERQQSLFDRATGVEAMRSASREAVAQEQAAAKIQEAQAKAQEAEQSQQRKIISGLVNKGYADAIEPSVIKRTYGQGIDPVILAELQRAARDQKSARKNAQQVISDYLLQLAGQQGTQTIKKP